MTRWGELDGRYGYDHDDDCPTEHWDDFADPQCTCGGSVDRPEGILKQ